MIDCRNHSRSSAGRLTLLAGIAALALGLSQTAAAAPARLSIISNGEVTGYVSAEEQGGRMVVDYHVDRAVLLSGVGRRQDKITIRRGG